MESLSDEKWDVLISGTGLAQSLLALALSRSGKKVLHIDQNNIYGGHEAALSLQDAEAWKDTVNEATQHPSFPFESAKIIQHQQPESSSKKSRLGSPRAYSLSLSPQLIYTQSSLIPLLVSSHVYQTLEFLAVGSWWVAQENEGSEPETDNSVLLKRIPMGREDIFADDSINVRSKRALMKFLRHVLQGETEDESRAAPRSSSFEQALKDEFHISGSLQQPLLALSLSPENAADTAEEFAVRRIARHMKSIGIFGPGFGSLLVKWGGLSEIAQASCRALAVGGGVYVLGREIKAIHSSQSEKNPTAEQTNLTVELSDGEKIEAAWIAGGASDLPPEVLIPTNNQLTRSARAIHIVSSPLEQLFSTTSDSGPPPAGVVVVFPGGPSSVGDNTILGPTYLFVHSSDTGECPNGQCIVYASCAIPPTESSDMTEHIRKHLDVAVERLLAYSAEPVSTDQGEKPAVLWSMHYTLRGISPLQSYQDRKAGSPTTLVNAQADNILVFPPQSLDLAFDDSMIDHVRTAWAKITGSDPEFDEEGFMRFERREEMVDE